VPIFVQFSGIRGDVRNVSGLPGHGWIEVSSMQWGVGRSISSPSGGSSDREASKPSVSEIVVTKKTDLASPSLFNECLGGPRRRLTVTIVIKQSGSETVYHTISITNATITGFTPYTPTIHKGKSTRREKLTIAFSEYDFNGLGNVAIPYTLIPPQGSPSLPVNEGGYVRSQEIWTAFRLTPAQIR
jgi:type VI secretion system secreted protein Hcp